MEKNIINMFFLSGNYLLSIKQTLYFFYLLLELFYFILYLILQFILSKILQICVRYYLEIFSFFQVDTVFFSTQYYSYYFILFYFTIYIVKQI